nr:MAG TPA: hypothetical protein [Caudoviricetes sp.]
MSGCLGKNARILNSPLKFKMSISHTHKQYNFKILLHNSFSRH